jgi:hypothetical protein
MTDELVTGRRNSLRETILVAALASMILPGIGVLVIPTMFSDDPPPWPLLLWTVFWAAAPFIVRGFQRVHRVVGDEVVSTYQRREIRRALADVVELRPLGWYFPGARIAFADGSGFRVTGRKTSAILAEARAHAPFATDRLPDGDWLRSRRMVWFVLGFVLEVGDSR